MPVLKPVDAGTTLIVSTSSVLATNSDNSATVKIAPDVVTSADITSQQTGESACYCGVSHTKCRRGLYQEIDGANEHRYCEQVLFSKIAETYDMTKCTWFLHQDAVVTLEQIR